MLKKPPKKRPVSAADATLDDLLLWASRSAGWNGRDYPPIARTLEGGCELVVIVPRLWQGRPSFADPGRLRAKVYSLAEQRRLRRGAREVRDEQRRA